MASEAPRQRQSLHDLCTESPSNSCSYCRPISFQEINSCKLILLLIQEDLKGAFMGRGQNVSSQSRKMKYSNYLLWPLPELLIWTLKIAFPITNLRNRSYYIKLHHINFTFSGNIGLLCGGPYYTIWILTQLPVLFWDLLVLVSSA